MLEIMQQEELTVDEVAKRLRVHRETVIRRIETGQLLARKEGREWRIHPDDLDAYIRSTYPKKEESR